MTMSVLAVGETLSVGSPHNTTLTFCLLAQTITDEKGYLLSPCPLVAQHDNTHTHIHLGTVITVFYTSIKEISHVDSIKTTMVVLSL